LLVGRCFGIQLGAGAIWLNLTIKVFYYSFQDLVKSEIKLITIVFALVVSIFVIFAHDRLDMLIAIITSIIDIFFLQGGTVKYPKTVLQ